MIALRIDARDGGARPRRGDRRRGGRPARRRRRSTVRGPAEAPLAMLRGRIRWQVWLASRERAAVAAAAARRRSARSAPRAICAFAIDVDPHSTPVECLVNCWLSGMKLLIIAGPYEADRLRKAAVSAGFEARRGRAR